MVLQDKIVFDLSFYNEFKYCYSLQINEESGQKILAIKFQPNQSKEVLKS